MSWTKLTKNTTDYVNQVISGFLGYILTDSSDYVLLGSNSDEVLIFNSNTNWSNLTKH